MMQSAHAPYGGDTWSEHRLPSIGLTWQTNDERSGNTTILRSTHNDILWRGYREIFIPSRIPVFAGIRREPVPLSDGCETEFHASAASSREDFGRSHKVC